MNFNNDYLKGYLAALRTVQSHAEGEMKEVSQELDENSIHEEYINLCKSLRQHYKDLVEQLNSQSENKNGTKGKKV